MSSRDLPAALLATVLFLPVALEAQEREEPDFAFLASGPYTQKKGTFQLISATRFDTEPGNPDQKFRSTMLRAEYGFTDRLEMDLILNGQGWGERRDGRIIGFFTRADSVAGLRYRFLDESRGKPITFTTGPQVILPTGRQEMGTGTGRAGYAWDAAAARDFGRPAFLYLALNYAATPGFADPTPGSSRRFLLHALTWNAALGLRPLERESQSKRRHDVHVFLEIGGTREDNVAAGASFGRKFSTHQISFAPGLRYGFLTPAQTLVEIGVSVPVGVNRAAPDYGLIVQFQFEAFAPWKVVR